MPTFSATGTQQWALADGSGMDFAYFEGLAVDAEGAVLTTDGRGNLEKISAGGQVLWTRSLPDAFPYWKSRHVAVAPTGNVILWTEELVQVYAPDYGPLRWQAALPAHASVAVGPHGELLVAAPRPTDAN